MAKIKIVIDTSADMPEELIKKYDFSVMRFMSVFGDKSYTTGVDITNSEFYDMLDKSKKIPTTSQTPYMTMYETLLEESKKNDTVIYFTISSKASGQNHTAHMIVDEIKEEANPEADIRIVDTMSFSVYIASMAVYAAELINEGKEADEVIEKSLEYISGWKSYLLVDDMKYLEKGGRINKTTAVVGSLLDIKPVLTIRNGLVEFEDKLRGKKKLCDKLISKMEEDPDYDPSANQFMVVHSDEVAGEELKSKIEENYGEGTVVMMSEFGPIVGTHVGRGAFAILFRRKK